MASRLRNKHGLTKTPETRKCYEAWLDIKRKCYDVNSREYVRYGAKGREMQSSWLDDPTAFTNYMLALPDFSLEMTIDRSDNTKGYEEGNLRWATPQQQARNRGIYSTNNSGYQGVVIRRVRKATFISACWFDLETRKAKSKTFAVNKFGLLPAFKMACEYRDYMMQVLNTLGAGYSDNHEK